MSLSCRRLSFFAASFLGAVFLVAYAMREASSSVIGMVVGSAPLAARVEAAVDDLPVVFMHGIADSASSSATQQLVASVQSSYPSKDVVALPVSDGLASILRPMGMQLDELVRVVRSDARLARGFAIARCREENNQPKHIKKQPEPH